VRQQSVAQRCRRAELQTWIISTNTLIVFHCSMLIDVA